MAEPNQKQTEDNSQNPPNNTSGSVYNQCDSGSTINGGEGAKKEEKPPPPKFNYTIVEDNWKKREAVRANRIANRTVWINVIIIFIAFGAFWQTQLSIENAREQFNILNKSTIRLDYMCFAYTPDFSNKPITPGHEMNILFYVSANPRPIHMYYYKTAFVFADTTKDRIDSLRNAMKNTSDMNQLDQIIGTGTYSFFKKELMIKSPSSTDSIRFNEGKCLFALRIAYKNDVSHDWQEYLIIATLKNKFSQESFINNAIENNLNVEDKDFKVP